MGSPWVLLLLLLTSLVANLLLAVTVGAQVL
jgi:hypothetical protein